MPPAMPRALDRRTVVTLLVAAIPSCLLAQAAPPRTGTWELDLQKSTFNPGPGPRQQTRVDRQTATGLEATVTGVTGTGMEINYRYAPAFGGPDVPIVGTGVPSGGDSIGIRRIDERTIESILRRSGMVVLTRTEVVSVDGRMLTITSRGRDASGAAASNVTVYNRR